MTGSGDGETTFHAAVSSLALLCHFPFLSLPQGCFVPRRMYGVLPWAVGHSTKDRIDDAFDAKAAEGCAEKGKTNPEEGKEKFDKVDATERLCLR